MVSVTTPALQPSRDGKTAGQRIALDKTDISDDSAAMRVYTESYRPIFQER